MIKYLRYKDEFGSIYFQLDDFEDVEILADKLCHCDNKNNWSIGLFGSKKKARYFIEECKRVHAKEKIFEAIEQNKEVEDCSIKINFEVPTNEKGQNSRIVPHFKATPKKLFDNGFSYPDGEYYLFKKVLGSISFDISVNLLENSVEINIFDEDSFQPYDYQDDIRRGRVSSCTKLVHKKVQDIMKDLIDKEIIMGYSPNDYI